MKITVTTSQHVMTFAFFAVITVTSGANITTRIKHKIISDDKKTYECNAIG